MLDRVGIEVTGLKELSRDVRRANKGLANNLRKKLAEAGRVVADDWKRRESWSSRIPGSIRVSSTQRGVKVIGGGKKAPHLAAYERPTFRHPVFGNRNVWVAQQGKPGGLPALNAHLEDVVNKAAEALDLWAQEAGFR